MLSGRPCLLPDQLLPISAVAGKARDLARCDRANLAQANLCHHPFEAGALDAACRGTAKIVIHLALGWSEILSAIIAVSCQQADPDFVGVIQDQLRNQAGENRLCLHRQRGPGRHLRDRMWSFGEQIDLMRHATRGGAPASACPGVAWASPRFGS